ncbi:hypothetical protein [Streptomyces sp. XD-27]|uniref:hypothetical protein n=1 Tax=Streptomyces sp. XD-27 TaxID=3062779 RepID=UPI0026F4312E|nr:hypothetical protein [Streptomyces sp. XD-27]WKX70341.1 hypothetical protein Q3Y56_10790 [Streptomyces sp. XD-27]
MSARTGWDIRKLRVLPTLGELDTVTAAATALPLRAAYLLTRLAAVPPGPG